MVSNLESLSLKENTMSDVQFLDTPRPEDETKFLDTPAPEKKPSWQDARYGWDLMAGKPMPQSWESISNEPGLQDVSVGDAMAVQGAAGLAKAGVGLAGKGIGMALDALPATENVVPSIGRIANNQTLKNMGGTMGQINQMSQGSEGRIALDKAAKYARDNGLADVFSSNIGREKQLESLLGSTGKTVGDLRAEAGPAQSGVLEKVESDLLANKYSPNSLRSAEAPAIEKTSKAVREMSSGAPATHAGYGEAATDINKFAAGKKMYQPVTAETDFANALSRENDKGIVQTLGSDKGKQYVGALEEQTRLHPLEHLQQRGELREMAGRGGLSLSKSFVQKLADSFGYRLTAKTAGAIHDLLTAEGLPQASAQAVSGAPKMIPAGVSEFLTDKYGNR
jgi:hypothetical protein